MSRAPFILLLLVLTLASCATTSARGWKRNSQIQLEESERMIQTGQRRLAVDELSMLIEIDPQNEQARLLRGIAYQGLEEYQLAIQDYEAVLKKNPAAEKAHYNLGMIYAFKINEVSKALDHFDQFLSLQPDHSKAYAVAKIMRSIEDQGIEPLPDGFDQILEISDLTERRQQLQEAASRFPSSPLPHYFIGKSYEQEGDLAKAIESYETALKIRPTSGAAHRSLANLLLKKGRKGESKIHQTKASLFESSDPELSD